MKHFYREVPGWFFFEGVYAEAVRHAEDGAHFVEIGGWKGKSTSFMGVEIANSGKKIKFDCVDTWLGSQNEIGHLKDADVSSGRLFEVFKKNISPVADFINPVQMDSVEASKLYKDNSLDFILIDGAHDYDSVKKDIEAWLPKLKADGMMAGDDFEPEFPGVTRAVQEKFGSEAVLSRPKAWVVDRRKKTTPKKYDVILRTHSGANVHAGVRFVDVPKIELIIRCLRSLVRSINLSNEDFRLTIIDDHSSEDCLSKMRTVLAELKHSFSIIPLKGIGNGESLKAVYEYARDYGREIIYFVEDDYLHFPEAISEMISEYDAFKKNLGGREVAVHPGDDPKDYQPKVIFPTRIVLGQARHWRTNIFTTGTFMTSRDVLLGNWDNFMNFTLYGKPGITEDTTINQIWRTGGATLFTPIRSLAIHMQFPEDVPYFTDWQSLWKQNG